MTNGNIPNKKNETVIPFNDKGNIKLKKPKPKKKVKKEKKESPRVLTCILTSKTFKIAFPALLKQMVRLKFDSLDEYQEYYICKEARKLLASGKTVEEIRKEFHCELTKEIPFKILKCYIKKIKTKEDLARQKRREMVKVMLSTPRDENTKAFCGKQTIPYDLNNEQHISELTKDACIRQDIYLNSGKVCDECRFYKFCKCKARKVSKYYDK